MKRFILRSFLSILAISIVSIVSIYVWLSATAATAQELNDLKPGDIVFQTSRSNQSLAIMLASQSLYSHMGIVDVEPDGSLVVLEAISTVQSTPLTKWVDRGLGKRVLVKRHPGLSKDQVEKITREARSHFGKSYDIFFFEDRKTIYCSELVDFAFRDGTGISVGEYQSVRTLNFDNFASRKVIERRWKKHPLCEGTTRLFEDCFQKILNQSLITPSSIAEDKALITVYTNYPYFSF